MTPQPPSVVTAEAEQSQRRVALGVGLASLLLIILGPLALWLGLRARRRAPDACSSAAIIMGGAATLTLALALVAVSVGLGMYLAAGRGSGTGLRVALPSLRDVGRALMPERAHRVMERVQLSADQQEFVDTIGWPDSFVLSMDQDNGRVEIWQYFRCNSDDPLLREDFQPCRVSFVGGEFRNVEHFKGTFAPRPLGYRPTEFDETVTPEQVRKALGRPSWTRDPTVEPFGKVEILTYAKEAVFLFREGKLWGVVTIAQEV